MAHYSRCAWHHRYGRSDDMWRGFKTFNAVHIEYSAGTMMGDELWGTIRSGDTYELAMTGQKIHLCYHGAAIAYVSVALSEEDARSACPPAPPSPPAPPPLPPTTCCKYITITIPGQAFPNVQYSTEVMNARANQCPASHHTHCEDAMLSAGLACGGRGGPQGNVDKWTRVYVNTRVDSQSTCGLACTVPHK